MTKQEALAKATAAHRRANPPYWHGGGNGEDYMVQHACHASCDADILSRLSDLGYTVVATDALAGALAGAWRRGDRAVTALIEKAAEIERLRAALLGLSDFRTPEGEVCWCGATRAEQHFANCLAARVALASAATAEKKEGGA
jgi:hypothetical protein